jgi:hypothetical protein
LPGGGVRWYPVERRLLKTSCGQWPQIEALGTRCLYGRARGERVRARAPR